MELSPHRMNAHNQSSMPRLANDTRKWPCLFIAALVLLLAVPDAGAAYLVQRSSYVHGLPATDGECGAQGPASDCDPTYSQSNATSVSGSVNSGSYSGFSSADLATGELKIQSSGPMYEAIATASLMDQLTFTNIAPGTSQTIGIMLNLDGAYRDGSGISIDAGFS